MRSLESEKHKSARQRSLHSLRLVLARPVQNRKPFNAARKRDCCNQAIALITGSAGVMAEITSATNFHLGASG